MAPQMLAITIPTFADPSAYELSTVTRPTITDPDDVIVQVHAAGINPIDVKKANGVFKAVLSDQFPYKIGYDCAGVVTEVGNAVTDLKVGDEVYTRLPEMHRGSWSEYIKSTGHYIARKPQSLSFIEAASLPLAAVTAMQAFDKYRGSLAGKTVFVPGGLSGVGACACQLAKNVYQAGKVITTVSTSKVDKVATYLGHGVVDQVIDYTKENPCRVIPPRSVDFILDTTGEAMTFLSLMTPQTSFIVSISTMPSGTTLQNAGLMKRPDNPRVPFALRTFLDAADAVRRYRAWRWSVEYAYIFLDPNAKELDKLSGYVEEGKVKPVVGAKVPFRDIETVKEACWQTYNGKGGIGKTVFEVMSEK